MPSSNSLQNTCSVAGSMRNAAPSSTRLQHSSVGEATDWNKLCMQPLGARRDQVQVNANFGEADSLMHNISTTAANQRVSGNGRVRKRAHEPLIEGRCYFEIIQIRSRGIPESTSRSEIARKHCHDTIFTCRFCCGLPILMDRLHGIDGALRTRLQRSPSQLQIHGGGNSKETKSNDEASTVITTNLF
jgi:hypothetical protein